MKEIVIIIQNKYYKGSIVNTSFIGCVTAYNKLVATAIASRGFGLRGFTMISF